MLPAQLLTAGSRASPLPHAQTFILADFCFYYVKSYAEGGCSALLCLRIMEWQEAWDRKQMPVLCFSRVVERRAACAPPQRSLTPSLCRPLPPLPGTGVIHLPAGIV